MTPYLQTQGADENTHFIPVIDSNTHTTGMSCACNPEWVSVDVDGDLIFCVVHKPGAPSWTT